LSQYVQQNQNQLAGEKFSFNLFQNVVFYQSGNGQEQSFSMPYVPSWSPLGIRVDQKGQLYLTDVEKGTNSVMVINPANGIGLGAAKNQVVAQLGSTGEGNGQLSFPNSAVADSEGRVYVSDGNNGRISVWDAQGKFLFNFGRGTGEGALSLPRGMMIDQSERLYVVDAVGQNIKVYDVSASEPRFLFVFGDYGSDDGLFNYPNDIALDNSGRLYIVDRENNRVQVWSY
jgi:DNA-binding beta-propeller fold protein YncE